MAGRSSPPAQPYQVAVPYSAAEAPRIDRTKASIGSTWRTPRTRQGCSRASAPSNSRSTGSRSKTVPSRIGTPTRPRRSNGPAAGAVDAIATITATGGIFKPGHVGGAFIFEVHDFSISRPGSRTNRRNDDRDRRAAPLGRQGLFLPGKGRRRRQPYTGTIQPTHTEGDEWDGSGDKVAGTDTIVAGVLWRYEYDRFGVGVITEVVSSTPWRRSVSHAASPTRRPDVQVGARLLSPKEGWPHLVTVWGGRLIFFKGVEIIGSVVGDYFNFSPITSNGTCSRPIWRSAWRSGSRIRRCGFIPTRNICWSAARAARLLSANSTAPPASRPTISWRKSNRATARPRFGRCRSDRDPVRAARRPQDPRSAICAYTEERFAGDQHQRLCAAYHAQRRQAGSPSSKSPRKCFGAAAPTGR
jgi:hypothetical protein